MDFTRALTRFILVTLTVAAICLIAVGTLLILFPTVLFAAVLYSAGAVFILLGVIGLASILFALLRTMIEAKRRKGEVENV